MLGLVCSEELAATALQAYSGNTLAVLYRTNPVRSPVITSHKSQMLIELSKKTWFFVTKKTWFFLGNNGAKVALLNFD